MNLTEKISNFFKTKKMTVHHPTKPDHFLTVERTFMERLANKNRVATAKEVMSCNNANYKKIFRSIISYVDAAELKHPIFPQNSVYQGSLIAEEAGEVVQAINNLKFEGKGNINLIEKEMYQTIAVIVRCLKQLK